MEECGSREEMGMLLRDLEAQIQLLPPAQSPWQHHRGHSQVTLYMIPAKVKQAESTKVVLYPAPS